ncbi:MAG: hypothetical protein M1813_001611 [Trichoglossum hirsutum]|nr:MAG: hypothetical protein M1813_001611 [Trichoglossum hirsutum]
MKPKRGTSERGANFERRLSPVWISLWRQHRAHPGDDKDGRRWEETAIATMPDESDFNLHRLHTRQPLSKMTDRLSDYSQIPGSRPSIHHRDSVQARRASTPSLAHAIDSGLATASVKLATITTHGHRSQSIAIRWNCLQG